MTDSHPKAPYPGDLQILQAERDDLFALRGSILGGNGAGILAYSRDLSPKTKHWEARLDGLQVGCISLMCVRGHVIRGMAVLPTYEGRGIGSRLLEVAKKEAGGGMWCNARLSAVSFYLRHGWVKVGPVFEMKDGERCQRMVWISQR